jgi:cholesterol transport system auxiliary component
MRIRLGRAAALGAAMISLAGCISVLPKEKPAQLYRFGVQGAVASAPTGEGARHTMRAAPYSFVRDASGDRILTVSGEQTAYIAGARWVIPANVLFEDAVTRAFQARGGPLRLLARDEPVAADYVLKLDVRTFEARYTQGHGAPPTVVVEAYAGLVGRPNAASGVGKLFRAEAPAGTDTVRAIVAAYDVAVSQVLGEMVAWVETSSGG